MATATVALDTRHPKGADKDQYFAMLRITDERKSKYYPVKSIPKLNRTFTKKEFDRIMTAQRRTDAEKEYKAHFDGFTRRAEDCIEKLDIFTFEAFEALYIKNRGARDSIKAAFEAVSMSMRKEGRIGTAVQNECASVSLEKFKPGMRFVDVTPALLEAYEQDMIKNGRSKTTVGMYTRALRAVFNEAIGEGTISNSIYPFKRTSKDRNKYAPPTGKGNKRALKPEAISKLYYYTSDIPSQQQAVDFWKFSYLCNGMNMKDVLNLRHKDIDGDYLTFERAKTEETKGEPELITVHLKEDAKAIIKKYGTKSISPNVLLFPVLTDKMDAEEQYKVLQNYVQWCNKNLKKVCTELKIPVLTTYSARHSFAGALKDSGVSADMIQEFMGHSDVRTTKAYLKNFDKKVIANATDVLVPLKKVN
ncbi:MAG: site-specific integrase [Niabella sp.]|nr:site-specific integrase [Niabella sp.]